MKKLFFLLLLFAYYSCSSTIVVNRDTNKDGRIDTILYYSKKKKNKKVLIKVEKDLNYNSKFERNLYFKNNRIEKVEKDVNEDGQTDWIVYFKNNKAATIEKVDNEKNIVIRRLEKIDNKRKKVYIDKDRDGIFDHIIYYYNNKIVSILSDKNKDGIFEKEEKLSPMADLFIINKKPVRKKIIKAKIPEVKKILILPFRNLTKNRKVDYLKNELQSKFKQNWDLKSNIKSTISFKSKKEILRNGNSKNYILDGSFIYYRNKLRIIMKILDTKTGRIIASKSLKRISPEAVDNELQSGVSKLANHLTRK